MPSYGVRANAALPNATTKVAAQLATGANITAKLVGFSISFNGVDGSKAPVSVRMVKPTAASSGGSSFTPLQRNGRPRTAQATARVNDTTPGTGAVIHRAWYVPPTSGLDIEYPLGREFELSASEFLELQVVTTENLSALSYEATLIFEEG